MLFHSYSNLNKFQLIFIFNFFTLIYYYYYFHSPSNYNINHLYSYNHLLPTVHATNYPLPISTNYNSVPTLSLYTIEFYPIHAPMPYCVYGYNNELYYLNENKIIKLNISGTFILYQPFLNIAWFIIDKIGIIYIQMFQTANQLIKYNPFTGEINNYSLNFTANVPNYYIRFDQYNVLHVITLYGQDGLITKYNSTLNVISETRIFYELFTPIIELRFDINLQSQIIFYISNGILYKCDYYGNILTSLYIGQSVGAYFAIIIDYLNNVYLSYTFAQNGNSGVVYYNSDLIFQAYLVPNTPPPEGGLMRFQFSSSDELGYVYATGLPNACVLGKIRSGVCCFMRFVMELNDKCLVTVKQAYSLRQIKYNSTIDEEFSYNCPALCLQQETNNSIANSAVWGSGKEIIILLINIIHSDFCLTDYIILVCLYYRSIF